MMNPPEMVLAPACGAAGAPQPGLYRHYKGQHYQVLGLARHSETEEWLVVYQALYGERGYWLRPLSLWLEPVVRDAPGAKDEVTERSDAATRDGPRRFTLIETNGHTLDAASGSR
jgi:hypothetical protein